LKARQLLQQYIFLKLTKNQRVCCLSYCLKTRLTVFTSNIECVHLAGRRI